MFTFPFLSLVCIICLWLLGMARIMGVAKFRNRLISEVFKREDWREQSVIFNTVSFDKMILQFWKPLKIKSFYPNNFLN